MGGGFRQALLLADCLSAGDLDRYNRMHGQTLRLAQTMSSVLLLMDRSPFLRDRAIRMLASEPGIFARMLGVHLGAESVARFVAAKGMDVAWRMLVPRAPQPVVG